MSKLNPWTVTWWCNNTDKARKQCCRTHEEALRLQAKLKRQGHNNVQIKS